MYRMGRPLFSLVVTTQEGTAYLDEFIESVDAQTLTDYEVVAVDSGTDVEASRALEAWAARSPAVRIVTGDATVAGARNAGLAAANGTWVSFPRCQDKLAKTYLASLAAALSSHTALSSHAGLSSHERGTTGSSDDKAAAASTGDITPTRSPAVELLAARKKRWSADDSRTQAAPLAELFDRTRVVDLHDSPALFHTDLDTAFFPLDALRATGLRFDERVTPNFNGGHFSARWMLTRANPRVLFVREAVYSFRVRSRALPLDPTLRDPRRFSDVPRIGFLQLLEEAARAPGGAPGWLRSALLYELSVYLRRDQQVTRAPSVQAGALADEFRATLGRLAELLDPPAEGLGFLTPEWTQVLFAGLAGKPFVAPYAVVDRYDADADAVRVWFTYSGAEPSWEFRNASGAVEPLATKVRGLQYFGAVALHKRIAWVRLGAGVSLHLDGREVPLVREAPGRGESPTPISLPELRELGGRTRPKATSTSDRLAAAQAGLPWVRRRYRDAWIVMDRLTDADDNGERLFEYLRSERPDLNAWFVLDGTSPDFARMTAVHGDRVVAHGSQQWLSLALNTRVLASSHITPAILNPPQLRGIARQPWKIAFLQHGVVRDDVSRWFNRQYVDLIVASTAGEYASFVADETNYELTTREARLVGLARFDRLLRLGTEYPAERQDLVLVTPTWRNDLQVSDGRQPVASGFLESPFARNWLTLLRDDGFRQSVAAAGKRVGFLPHPNLQSIVPELALPGDIEVLSYAGQDVQRFIARAAFQLTDYSSMAFNTAYLDRPVIYFQFDSDDFFSGANNSRPGYFDFERDGFGPVTTTVEETVDATRLLLGGTPQVYVDRIRGTFPERDGRCCERTVAAIEALLG